MKKSDEPRISSLGYALLSLLARRDRSGYELSRSTSAPRDSLLWSAGHSQIYPELGKLANAGYVSFAAVAQARRPDKKVYRLSEAGARALKAWVRLPPSTRAFRTARHNWPGSPGQRPWRTSSRNGWRRATKRGAPGQKRSFRLPSKTG